MNFRVQTDVEINTNTCIQQNWSVFIYEYKNLDSSSLSSFML